MEQKYHFEFTQAELNVIAAALGKLPMENAISVFNSIQQQFQAQQVPPGVKEEQPELPPEKPRKLKAQ